MADALRFHWEVQFAQKTNGFTQDLLLKAFQKAADELAARFATDHGLEVGDQRITLHRSPTNPWGS